jgi:hypothetical protein
LNSSKSLDKQIVSIIYGKGRGWSFSKKDFSHLGELASIDRTLSRMAEKGTIRRVIRGLYDYPAYSKLLKKDLSPDINQVAHALARKFGWTIQISGNAALNLVGLSTQIPTQYLYLSDGPSKSYQLGNTEVTFKKTGFTQLGFKYAYNEILVQAIQALGDRALSAEELQKLRLYLLNASKSKADGNDSELPRVLIDRTLKDTQFVTSWIVRNIRQVLLSSSESQEIKKP